MHVRVLMNMYRPTGHLIRISWAIFDHINALNGVKQGEVVSPILFCIHNDGLLVSLYQTGVGCYVVGALAYADDIVLTSPTPLGMTQLLFTCDSYGN